MTQQRPLTSIILPTHNRAPILWRAVQSVLAQTEARWELVIVDDGSTDCTQRMLEEFRDPRIKVVETENRGPSAARNRGIELACGEFVAYLDSDNIWHDDFLEKMLAAAIQNEDDVLWYCGADVTLWERDEQRQWSIIEQRPEPRRQYSLADAWRLKAPDTNCMLHRRGIAKEVGGWDEACRWLEDWDFFLRVCLRHPGQIRWVPHVLVNYRQVHGTGADGICAEAREDGQAEVAGRRYLLEKWGSHPDFDARDKLDISHKDLPKLRAPDMPNHTMTSLPNQTERCDIRIDLSQGSDHVAECEQILRGLPGWFGIEEAIVDYVEQIGELPTLLARTADETVGFLSIEQHSNAAAEIIVMGVAKSHHRRGIGRALLDAAETHLRGRGVAFLQVKTLSASHDSPEYALTRRFYRAVGFKPLQEFPTLWHEANPCLQMVKWLG
ncbi:MAG: GNAT family N-acetyltransferase [Persicimonas sp.]